MAKEYQIEEAESNTNNKDFFDKAIDDGATWTLAYASEDLKDNRNLILKCAKVDGQILYYASQRLRDDREVVLTAVTQKWRVLKFASLRLRNDIEIAKVALTQDLEAKNYLGEEALKNEVIQTLLNPPSEEG